MSEDPTLSIVVPSLNQAEFIESTLLSLQRQKGITEKELEVIVIDGASSDETVDLLRRWEQKIKFRWLSEPDTGQTDALIKGFRMSSGEIMGWLCADDALEPHSVREVLDLFRTTPQAEFVYGDALWIGKNGEPLRPKREIPFNWFIWLHGHNYIPQPAAFWRRSLYRRVGGLDPLFDVAMDADLFARFARTTSPIHVPRRWARIRVHPEQKTQRLASRCACETAVIQQRQRVLFRNPVALRVCHYCAKALRVGWKLSRGAYGYASHARVYDHPERP